jgi:hypothetical protein
LPERFLQICHFVSVDNVLVPRPAALRSRSRFKIRMNPRPVSNRPRISQLQYSAKSVWLRPDLKFLAPRAEYVPVGR